MRMLFAVQRYGHEVAGGAERACRELASELAGRGHEVEVLTSRATSYASWENSYPPGTVEIDGVKVHRLSTARSRDERVFGPLDGRVAWGQPPVPLYLQEEWMRQQGPDLPELPGWLARRAASYDVAAFFCYLYPTAWAGLPVAAARTPTVFHPLAHDEPMLALPLYETAFRSAAAFAFLTDEEQELVERTFRPRQPSEVIGTGFDLDVTGDGARFRAMHGLSADDPYLLFIGRIDPSKGAFELLDYFRTLKVRHPGPLRLVFLGEGVHPIEGQDDMVVTGFVDEQTKRDAIDGSVAVVVPSFFESLSMALIEAWIQRRPALVQGRCAVLAGQAARSGGAIPYSGFAEFEAAVELVSSAPGLADALAAAGRSYVEHRYRWDLVLDRYENLLERTVAG